MRYIHQLSAWPAFTWHHDKVEKPLASVRHRQGLLLGKLEGLGFQFREQASLENLTLDVIKTSEIEGEKLPVDQVRSSLAKKLGIKQAGLASAGRDVEGVVEMMLDATQKYNQPLTDKRLFTWHASLFPTGRSGMQNISVARWRNDESGPMEVVSGALGKEKVHFIAPEALRLKDEMKYFLTWFNSNEEHDPVLKAALAHLWFVTIHPFDDGNGRMARAIADMQLSRSDHSKQRFYSMSAQIRKERTEYYSILEKTQRGSLDITGWLLWFIECLNRSFTASTENLKGVLNKAKFWEKNQRTLLNERQRMMLNKLMENFNGKLTSSKWAKITKASPDTALRDIHDLIHKGILQKEDGGGRNTHYTLTL